MRKCLLICGFAVLAGLNYAIAGDGVRFDVPVLNAYGDPFLGEDNKPMSLGKMAIAALGASLERDRNEQSSEKADRFKLAVVIAQAERAGTPLKLTAKEITMINERLEKANGNAILVGRVHEMLEPPAEK